MSVWFTNKNWWLSTLDRMLKTAAQAMLIVIGGELHPKVNVDWSIGWQFIAAIALASLLTSIISTPFGKNKNDPQIL